LDSRKLIESCLAGCTEAQREAIRHPAGPLLVLAGPGSGKTRVITRRIACLVASGCRPDDIVAITFTNKAAGEMRRRVEALGVASGAWISTFHSFCARMLRVHGRSVGLKPSFTIYDDADSVSAVKRAMQELEIAQSLFQPSYVAKAISGAKNRLLGPEQMRESSGPPEITTVARIFERYEKLLRAANAVDFDDLLLFMVRLLQDAPETSEQLRRRFLHVLVDEYQDTNHAQYLIARGLAAGLGNICVTGDPDQSIYGWRGADLNNILQFEQDYPNAKVVRLEQNYRSTKIILRAADRLITNNLARKPKSLWTENAEGEPVRLFRLEDERQEADAVAADMARLFRDAGFVPRDVAVFYRLNAQSRVLESSLRAEGIPYTIVAGTEFFQRKEIKDLLAYLRLLDNPADDVSAERVANVPARRIGDLSVKRLKEWGSARGLSLLDAFARAEEAGTKGTALQGVAEFRRTLDELRAMPRTPVAKIVERLLEAIGYERYLASATDQGRERIENVRELVNAAAEYDEAEPEGNLLGFLEQAALISDTDRWDAERGGVTLMTLHAAKGLEFPAVYVVGLEDGLLPLKRDDGDHDLEEERRLFFVGLTRAKRLATLSFAETRARYGKREFTKPSQFLDELPAEIEAAQPAESFGAAARSPFRGARAKRLFGRMGASPEPRRVRRSENEEIVYDSDYPAADGLSAAIHAAAPFKPGDNIVHPTYGRGKVLSLSGYGDDLRATVRFPSVGVKCLILRLARMRKV